MVPELNDRKVGSKTSAALATLDAKTRYLEREVCNLRIKLDSTARINWLVVIGATSLTLTLLTMMGNAWIAPIELELQHLKELLK